MGQHRSLGIFIAILIAATPAVAAERSAIPDLSGHWGRNTVDPEPPASGPGPVMNKTKTFYMRVGDDTNPILKPAAAQAVRDSGAVSRTGENFLTPSNQCTPMPPPYIWRSMTVEVIQHKDRVTLLYGVDALVRRVRIGAAHPAPLTPTWYGDSVGHYEGDTLVIDTVGIRTGRYSVIDNYGTPRSAGLHLVERIRRIDAGVARRAALQSEKDSGRVSIEMGGASIDEDYTGKGLQVRFTVEDPENFTMPWSAEVTYRRAAGEWEERICADNRHNYINGTDVDVPRDDNPDF